MGRNNQMFRYISFAAAAAVLLVGASAQAEDPIKIKLEPFVTGVNAPLAMVQPAGDSRMFVIEQWGRVLIIEDGELNGTPFLDIRNLVIDRYPDFDERGLLGLAFHPDFANNGKFYVSYSGHRDWQGDLAKLFWWDHSNKVAEYTVSADDPNVADANSGRIISNIPWPQFNHNGHWIGFGPDGMLYISSGDGGYANDWGIGHNPAIGNGQDMADLHGKILRVDPATGEAAAGNPHIGDDNYDPKIWAAGFRNPWRCSFDMGGDRELFCGDVQQNSFEEVDIVTAGANYGWRAVEGTHCFDFLNPNDHPASCDMTGFTAPILEHNNCGAQPEGCLGISMTGGYVYRGANADWDGTYIYGDWSKQFGTMDGMILMGTKNADGTWTRHTTEVVNIEGNNPYILAFAQDAAGEVYALTSITTGPVGSLDTIYKIVPAN
jgi:glucose/arabinose dehydrogenase